MALVRTPALIQALMPRIRWHHSRQEPVVYLTFDDGPSPGITPWVLEELGKYGAKATFFVVGSQVARHPVLARQILQEGHSLGNHTYNHRNGWKTPPADYMREIERTRRVLARETGTSPTLFRPPYGKFNLLAKWAIQRKYQIVMWDVLARDFDPLFSAQACVANVINNTRPGSIIVMHDSAKCALKLREMLPLLLQHFSDKGYRMAAL
ncbi:MAG: polysaccharide deacetylase family protein [Bacteroidetes bacterium]|nr:polysaccharide deacetylase family protein [Bacteroidota bacterium]